MESDFTLGNDQFMRKTLYEKLGWDVTNGSFSSHIIAVAPFGGPIAVTKDTSQISSFTGLSTLDIYSPSGEKIGSGTVPEHITLIPDGMFWTGGENVVLLSKNGAILIYNIQGAGPSVFELLSISSDDRILNFCPFHRTYYPDDKNNVMGYSNTGNFGVSEIRDRFITGINSTL